MYILNIKRKQIVFMPIRKEAIVESKGKNKLSLSRFFEKKKKKVKEKGEIVEVETLNKKE